MGKSLATGWLLVITGVALGISLQARAGEPVPGEGGRWWMEGGIGGAQVDTRAQGLPGRHGAAILSAGLGFRATPELAIGFEYATSASLSGCERWDCHGRSWDFMPAFNRASVFGEMRLLQGRVRLRYGLGDVSYCYGGGAGLNLWYLALEDDDYVDFYSCDAVHGLVRSASIGYHWQMFGGGAPPVMAR